MARVISIAVKEGGANPETNSKLRLAIEMAKKFNMPRENVERAISRSLGAASDEKLEEISFEAYGPGGIALIIEGITDNKNRTLGEIKQILSQNGGKLVGEGAIKWMFERKGCMIVDCKLQIADFQDKEKLELTAIEAGAENLSWEEDILNIYTATEELEKVKKNLEEKGIKLESASAGWVEKEGVELKEGEKQACEKLFEALDESDAVQEIYSNLKS